MGPEADTGLASAIQQTNHSTNSDVQRKHRGQAGINWPALLPQRAAAMPTVFPHKSSKTPNKLRTKVSYKNLNCRNPSLDNPPEGTLGYITCAQVAGSTKRRKKMGSSGAYKTIGTFRSQE